MAEEKNRETFTDPTENWTEEDWLDDDKFLAYLSTLPAPSEEYLSMVSQMQSSDDCNETLNELYTPHFSRNWIKTLRRE